MVKKAKVELVGIQDVEMILNKLPAKFQARVINAALKEASKPLYEAARQNLGSAQWGAGLVRMIRQVSKRIKGIPGQEIGAMPTKRTRRNEAVWEDMGAYWLEWGTMEQMEKPREPKTRSLSEAQKRVGINTRRARIPATGWLRRAIDTTEKGIEQNYRNILWKKLNKSLLRKAKKIRWSGLQ